MDVESGVICRCVGEVNDPSLALPRLVRKPAQCDLSYGGCSPPFDDSPVTLDPVDGEGEMQATQHDRACHVAPVSSR